MDLIQTSSGLWLWLILSRTSQFSSLSHDLTWYWWDLLSTYVLNVRFKPMKEDFWNQGAHTNASKIWVIHLYLRGWRFILEIKIISILLIGKIHCRVQLWLHSKVMVQWNLQRVCSIGILNLKSELMAIVLILFKVIQGDSLTPLLFALNIEPLAEAIHQNTKIQGIPDENGSVHKMSLFANDIWHIWKTTTYFYLTWYNASMNPVQSLDTKLIKINQKR